MKRFKHPVRLMAICLAAVISAPAMAQDGAAPNSDAKPAGGQPDEAAMMAAMMELAKPGENHKVLEGTVGAWNYNIKFWLSPDPNAPPTESHGTTLTKSTMGGRYFVSENKGMMQMPGADGKMQDVLFQGMAIEGYDNAKKKFVASWIDNMGTGIMQLEGAYDPATRTLTYRSDYEPLPGMITKVRQTTTLTDRDHRTMEYFEQRGDREVKTMEVTYTRAASSLPRTGAARPLPHNPAKSASTTSE
jgi:Protein of unknown function (DUF1579)